MHIMIIWTLRPEHSKNAIARFNDTGGASPSGVTMLSRWHDVAGARGFAVAETEDLVAVSRWCHEWSDLLSSR